MGNSIRLLITFILAEICILHPLYQLASFGLGAGTLVPFWFAAVLAVLLLVINRKLNSLSYRNLLLVFVNAAILLIAVLVILQLNVYGGLVAFLNAFFLAVLLGRCIYFAVKGSLDVFKHFDFSILFIFLIILTVGSLNIPLGSGITWLMVSFVLNVATLSLAKVKGRSNLAWLGAALAAVVLLPMLILARYFLPLLFAPAQFLYTAGKPIAYTFRDAVGFFLSSYTTYLADKREQSSNLTTDTNKVEIFGNVVADSPTLVFIIKTINIIFLTILVIAAVLFVLYLLRLLLSWLLKRQGKALPSVLRPEHKFSWLGLWRGAMLWWGRLMIFLLPWLPVKLDISKAYRALLKWGSYRNYPRDKDETPYEYLERLNSNFPQHKEDLSVLTGYYVQYKYGQDRAAVYTSDDLKNTLRRLFLPRLTAFGESIRNR
ncbi:MAG: DUF4129 domain-containing protein [Desulfocucumaceae bacterium]